MEVIIFGGAVALHGLVHLPECNDSGMPKALVERGVSQFYNNCLKSTC